MFDKYCAFCAEIREAAATINDDDIKSLLEYVKMKVDPNVKNVCSDCVTELRNGVAFIRRAEETRSKMLAAYLKQRALYEKFGLRSVCVRLERMVTNDTSIDAESKAALEDMLGTVCAAIP